MFEHFLPALFAVLLWWASTGVILHLDGMPRASFRWSMLGATLLLLPAIAGLAMSRDASGVPAAYVAFTCGVFAWGWQQLAFYTGYLAGPRRRPCPAHCGGWAHFRHGVEATLYHELAIAAAALLILAVTWGGRNQVGTWTFLLLWAMHVSAKLNVFLGVRNLNEEFFPDHLRYLESFLRRRAMNPLLPVSLAASALLAAALVALASASDAMPVEAVGYTFLATLTILAILEHALMVLPIPAARLWGWGLRSRRAGEHGAGGPPETPSTDTVQPSPGPASLLRSAPQ